MRLELDLPPAVSCWVWPNWILLCSATKDLSEILSSHYHRPSAIWDGAVRLFGKKMHLHVTFPTSGVETWVFLPPLVAFLVSLFCSMAGVSGAFSSKPDWPLGILFGLRGFLGMYCGPRLQRFVSQRLIKGMLAVMMLFLACMYVGAFFEP
jgi:hypothetical protein